MLPTSELASAYTAMACEKRKAHGLDVPGFAGSAAPNATDRSVLESTSLSRPAPTTAVAPYQYVFRPAGHGSSCALAGAGASPGHSMIDPNSMATFTTASARAAGSRLRMPKCIRSGKTKRVAGASGPGALPAFARAVVGAPRMATLELRYRCPENE